MECLQFICNNWLGSRVVPNWYSRRRKNATWPDLEVKDLTGLADRPTLDVCLVAKIWTPHPLMGRHKKSRQPLTVILSTHARRRKRQLSVYGDIWIFITYQTWPGLTNIVIDFWIDRNSFKQWIKSSHYGVFVIARLVFWLRFTKAYDSSNSTFYMPVFCCRRAWEGGVLMTRLRAWVRSMLSSTRPQQRTGRVARGVTY